MSHLSRSLSSSPTTLILQRRRDEPLRRQSGTGTVTLGNSDSGRGRLEDKQALNGLEGAQLDAEVRLSVETGAGGPGDAARAVPVADAALRGARGAPLQHAQDRGLHARHEDGGFSEPPGQARLERGLVRRAGVVGLALLLEHDARLGGREERRGRRVHEAGYVALPDRVLGEVVHVRRAVEVGRDVVGPLVAVDLAAVEALVVGGAVVDVVVVGHELDRARPVPDLGGPVREGLVAGVAG